MYDNDGEEYVDKLFTDERIGPEQIPITQEGIGPDITKEEVTYALRLMKKREIKYTGLEI